MICRGCQGKLLGVVAEELCLMCGGDTAGGGVCERCMQEADIVEVEGGMEDPGEEGWAFAATAGKHMKEEGATNVGRC